jgi:ATP-binding cassette subfamily F protein 3
VSHDRHLLRLTTDRLLLVYDGRVQEFDGSLDEYPAWLANRERAPRTQDGARVRSAAAEKRRRRDGAELRRRLSPLRRRLAESERKLACLEAQRREIEAQLADAGLYEDGGRGKLAALVAEQAQNARELARCEAEWLAAAEALEHAEPVDAAGPS